MICQRDWVFDGDSEAVLLPWRSNSYLCGLSLRWTNSNPNLHTSRVLPYSQMIITMSTWSENSVFISSQGLMGFYSVCLRKRRAQVRVFSNTACHKHNVKV